MHSIGSYLTFQKKHPPYRSARQRGYIFSIHTQKCMFTPPILLLRLLNLYDSCLLHRDTAVLVVTELYDYNVICDIENNSIETACCENAVANLHLGKCLIELLLLLLLWTDCDKVHKYNEENNISY